MKTCNVFAMCLPWHCWHNDATSGWRHHIGEIARQHYCREQSSHFQMSYPLPTPKWVTKCWPGCQQQFFCSLILPATCPQVHTPIISMVFAFLFLSVFGVVLNCGWGGRGECLSSFIFIPADCMHVKNKEWKIQINTFMQGNLSEGQNGIPH